MKRFRKVESHVAVLNRDDVDTDQIIPARFLKTTERTGLGTHLFEDWRYDADGASRQEFVLNTPDGKNAQILLGGRNFGCGSSREHAVWALLDFGINVVIAEGFADIFRKNSLRNGLLTISVDRPTHKRCLDAAENGSTFRVDLETQTVGIAGDQTLAFDVDPFARTCMLEGVDDLEYILKHEAEIAAFESAERTV